MMKKLALITTLGLATISTSALADKHEQRGGFNDGNQTYQKGGRHGGFVNSNQAVTTVSEAKNWNDDQLVVLQGKIVKQMGKDDFLFRDATGEIEVEIDNKAWEGVQITPNDEVKLYGEVDKSWNKTEVEIHRVEKVK